MLIMIVGITAVVVLMRAALLSLSFRKNRMLYSDETAHLAYEEMHRRNRQARPFYTSFTLERGNGCMGYPTLYQWFNSRILQPDAMNVRRIMTHMWPILGAFIFLLIGRLGFGYTLEACLLGVLAGLGGVAPFSATLFIISYRYTERSFADLLVFISFVSVCAFVDTGVTIYGGISLLAMLGIWFSSNFGMQALVFVSLVWVLLFAQWLPLSLVVLSYLVALAVNPPLMLEITRQKIAHSLWYARHNRRIESIAPVKEEALNSLKAILKEAYKRPFLGLFLCSFPLLPYFIYVMHGVSLQQAAPQFILSAFIVAFITSLKRFSFVGPAYRYATPALPLLWTLAAQDNHVWAVRMLAIEILISGVLFCVYLLHLQKFDFDDSRKIADLRGVETYLANTGETHKLAFSPVKLAYGFYQEDTRGHQYYLTFAFIPWSQEYLTLCDEVMPEFPYLTNETERLRSFCQEHSISFIICDTEFMQSRGRDEYIDGYAALGQPVFTNASFTVFKLSCSSEFY